MLGRAWLGWVAIAALLGVFASAPASAQDGEAPATESSESLGVASESDGAGALDSSELEQSGLLSDEQVLTQEQHGIGTVRSGTDPYEDPAATYYFLGFAYWHTFTPSFIIELFTDEATRARNPALALQFTYRRNSFDIVTSLFYQSYAVNGPFRGAGDPPNETEIIDSSLKALFVGVDFLWSTDFTDWFAIQYGIGLGVGVVLGDMIRTDAYPSTGAGSIDGWARCTGPTGTPAGFCNGPAVADGETGGHFGVRARRWTQGGSVPNVWFRAALPHLALRFKPIKQLMIRVDGGFDLFSGFFVGGSLNVGFGG